MSIQEAGAPAPVRLGAAHGAAMPATARDHAPARRRPGRRVTSAGETASPPNPSPLETV